MARTAAQPPNAAPPTTADPAGIAAQLFGVAAGPAAWILQLSVGYGLSSYACYPGDTPLRVPPDGGEHAVLLAVNLAALVLAAAGFAASLAVWRRVRGAARSPGRSRRIGRSRFLAFCGLLTAAGFGVAILFDLPSAVALRSCWSIPT